MHTVVAWRDASLSWLCVDDEIEKFFWQMLCQSMTVSRMLCRSVTNTRHVSQYFERTVSFGLTRCHLDLAARTLMTNKYLFDVLDDDINWCIDGLLGWQNPLQEIHH